MDKAQNIGGGVYQQKLYHTQKCSQCHGAKKILKLPPWTFEFNFLVGFNFVWTSLSWKKNPSPFSKHSDRSHPPILHLGVVRKNRTMLCTSVPSSPGTGGEKHLGIKSENPVAASLPSTRWIERITRITYGFFSQEYFLQFRFCCVSLFQLWLLTLCCVAGHTPFFWSRCTL